MNRINWTPREVCLVATHAAATVTQSSAEDLSQMDMVRQIDIAQRHVLKEDRWRNFANQNSLVSGGWRRSGPGSRESAKTNAQLALIALLEKEGWRKDGVRMRRYNHPQNAQPLSTVLPGRSHGPATYQDVTGIKKPEVAPPQQLQALDKVPRTDWNLKGGSAPVVKERATVEHADASVLGTLLGSALSSILSRLDTLEAKAKVPEVPKIDNAELIALREEVARLKDETQNALGFDDLIIEELGLLRETVLQVSRGIRTELPPSPSAPLLERQGKGPVVTIVGLRTRDEAVVNSKLRALPETAKLDVRFIEADRTPFSFKSEYAIVMRHASHSWYEHARSAVSDTANCQRLAHGGHAKAIEELKKIADYENQRRRS